MRFPFVHQYDQMDCGPACLKMISAYYGKNISLHYLRTQSYLNRNGVNLLGIQAAAELIGFETIPVNITLNELNDNSESLPCILHWDSNHFVVLYAIKKRSKGYIYHIADPAFGIVKLTKNKFLKSWINIDRGVVLFLGPSDNFSNKGFHKEEKKISLKNLLLYLKPYKKKVIIIALLLLLGSCITFTFPFLTQNLIDKGVNQKNFSIITLILLGQITLFIGNIIFKTIRDRLTLIIGTKIGITVISEFLEKIFKLSIKFFETKNIGDFNQRILDNERIEKFLTSHSLTTFFSVLTFSVFFIVLGYYKLSVLLIYACLSMLSILWSLYFLKRRKILDYSRFQQKGEHQESLYEIINGVTEMKLNQMEEYKRRNWEKIQQRLFITNLRILKLDQFQISGFEFINQLKNILVTFLAASLVIKEDITLGAMLSISYIIGQMNGPINQLVDFFQSSQDAKLSINRLEEVRNYEEEEHENDKNLRVSNLKNGCNGIILKNVCFQYEGPNSPYILRNLNITIPHGKVTAIVGASGSGKTTLMKLLLKFYLPDKGGIYYNGDNLNEISAKDLRSFCGVVMQDGYIFSDTIERNIAAGDDQINEDKLQHACKIANINDFINDSPLGYKKKIGASGSPVSGGQKQRILIARAVYKNPQYIFLDEATSALDAENENIIHNNLASFFRGKTVLVIAHRLSTVRNADQIIVLKKGRVVENGNHEMLVSNKSEYFNLVKNQLELGA